nr:MAG TPA: hypothetical protein [Caudoviricetes sp.]
MCIYIFLFLCTHSIQLIHLSIILWVHLWVQMGTNGYFFMIGLSGKGSLYARAYIGYIFL